MHFPNGTIYYPKENTFFALSPIINPKSINKHNISLRLAAFADLIESLVLAEEVVYDEDQDGVNLLLSQVAEEYNISQIVTARTIGLTTLGEHINSTLLAQVLSTQTKETLPKNNDDTALLKALLQQDLANEYLFDPTLAFQVLQNPEAVSEDLWDMISDNLRLAVYTDLDTLLSKGLLDYLPYVFKSSEYSISSVPAFAENFNSWEELFAFFQSNTPELSDDAREGIRLFLEYMFQFFMETALSSSLRDGTIFLPNELQRTNLSNRPIFAPSSKIILQKVGTQKYNDLLKLNDFVYGNYTGLLQLPLIFDYIIGKSNSLREFFQVALDLRDRKEVRRYRKWCSELDQTIKQGLHSEAIKMLVEAERFIVSINNYTKSEMKVQAQISFPPAVIFDIPTIELGRKNHFVFLKEVYESIGNPLRRPEKLKRIFNIRL